MASQLRKEMLTIGMAFFGNREDAEDVAQEGLVKLWSYCEHIDTERNVKALAVRGAKNCCVSIHRQRQLFEMRQLEGLSNDDITRQTGIPKNSVAVMVSAARKKVFQELTKRLKQ